MVTFGERIQCQWCDGGGQRNNRDCTACEGSGTLSFHELMGLWTTLINDVAQQSKNLDLRIRRVESRVEDLDGKLAPQTGGGLSDEIRNFFNSKSPRRHD